MGLIARNIDYSVSDHSILRAVNMEIRPGELHVLLGPNGAGKSTLLGLLTGDLIPNAGEIEIDGRAMAELRRKDLARRRAVLLQSTSIPFAYTSEQIVALGRLPHSGDDPEIVHQSMQSTQINHLKERIYLTLSGGEKQRVQLSRVICQLQGVNDQTYMLLDEPITGLDLNHQLRMLEIARTMSLAGCGVFLILHDPGLAARYADRISLIKEGRILDSGSPLEIMTEESLGDLYDIQIQVLRDEHSINAVIPRMSNDAIHQNSEQETKMKKEELAANWQKLREKDAHIRIRDAAQKLDVSEMELLLTRDTVTALRPEFSAIMGEAGSLGRVMALTRNEACVHERKGTFENISAKGGSGLVVGPDIDLRIFYDHWAHAFHVVDEVRGETRHSLQFFDKFGQAVHKIFQLESPEPFLAISTRFRAANADHSVQRSPETTPLEAKLKKDIDQNAFLEDWAALQDTHDFFGMLAQYGLHRMHALQMAEGRFTSLLSKSAISELLFRAAETGQEIMVFVGNPGMIQIHTGTISNVRPLEAWMNVLDSDFNLHLRTDLIDRAYLVEKPTRDGTVTSIEVFDGAGDLIVQFFGKRKPGIPEQESWRALAHSLVEKVA